MGRFLARRIPRALVVLIIISSIVFFTTRLSGDVVGMMLGDRVVPGQEEIIRKQLGLDRPLIVQFGDFWWDILHGDWGDSIWRHKSALSLVTARLPATLELAVSSFIITIVLSIPAGIFAAVKRGSKSDQAVMSIAVIGQAWPSFWMGIILILVFSVQFGWFPTHGRGDATAFFGVEWLNFSFHTLDGLKHLALPAIVLAFLPTAIIARITRSAMLEVLRQDYIRTARAKGLHESAVLLRHAVKNAAIPVVTIVGIQTGFFLAGAVITETVFAWPGLGRETIEAIQKRDFAVVQAAIIVIASIFVLVNLIIDMIYGFLDPRIRYN
jgi:peptide/nickel transport system permease protein